MNQDIKQKLAAKRDFKEKVLPFRKQRIIELGLEEFVKISGDVFTCEGDDFLYRLEKQGNEAFDQYLKELVARKEQAEGVCEWCEGTGEVATDEDDGEGHIMRGVGTKKCICQYDI